MFETVLSVAGPRHHVEIPADEQNLDGINYLLGKSLTEINRNAELGTILAHVDGNVPVLRIEIPGIDEYVLGQLIYFFEFACGVSGYTLKVNPFDQPGVEAYKKNMFRLLGKPGQRVGFMLYRIVGTVSIAENSEIVGNNLGDVSFVSVLVFPGSGLQFAFDVYLGSFSQYFLCYFSQGTPADYIVPFCLFNAFAFAISAEFCCGQWKGCFFHQV